MRLQAVKFEVTVEAQVADGVGVRIIVGQMGTFADGRIDKDDLGADLGSISGGWTIRITTTSCPGGPTATNTVTPTSTNTATPTATSSAPGSPSGTPSCTPAGTPVVLYDQTNNAGTNATNSQDFEAANDTFDNRGGDDFVVQIDF